MTRKCLRRAIVYMDLCHFALSLLLVVGASLWCSSAQAIAPPVVSDEELARTTTIVVAKWDKSPLVPHNLVVGNVCKELEVRTEIVVTRVIKGTLKPGKCTILLGSFIGWEKNGGPVMSYTSTEMLGDVSDVKEENLWFLQSRRSWDKSDKATYPAVETYRGVQPSVLESYFRAVAGHHPEEDVPKLLSSLKLIVVERALQYISGGMLPWPYVPMFDFERPDSVSKPLAAQSPSVEALLKRKEPEVRRLAASVYAALADQKCLPVMRRLLHDEDAQVRGIAIGILGRFQDSVSIESIATAVKGLDEPMLACQVIDRLAKWKDEGLVPVLIEFLENDRFAYQIGDDIGIPALKARQALHDRTGLWFPQDVDAGHRAWEKVRTLSNRQDRQNVWKTLVPDVACPFKAEFEGDEAKAHVVVTNVTSLAVTIAKVPSDIEQRWRSGDASAEQEGDDFITLKPSESTHFNVKLEESFVHARPETQRLIIRYWNSGTNHHVKAWIGSLEVVFGQRWKGPPGKLEKIVERWPNGDLKTTGEKRDGRDVGLWTYFNEMGDRIRTVDCDNGSTAECNPDHPNNKGLGKPKPVIESSTPPSS